MERTIEFTSEHWVMNSLGSKVILEDVLNFSTAPRDPQSIMPNCRYEIYRDDADCIIIDMYVNSGFLADDLNPLTTAVYRDLK